ncbi:hypothetical protein Q4588_14895 [Tamlana sp. 1_MG-2023]|uniref:hypothetical protein n=1 Tax=Tamlana sp. 1_MG-2023 TaxID=3062628 RepID=UPI0026E1BEFA|nr:hypothetical protein [Tamlana sp. 1_MG-2023]MDO6792195.1 hypothetical protein [Tamlana sp. 1_MG-2023]
MLSNTNTLLFNNQGEQLQKLSNERAFAVAISSDNTLVAILRDTSCVDIVGIEGALLCRLPLKGKQNGSMSGYSIEFIDDTTLLVGYTCGAVELKIEDVV